MHAEEGTAAKKKQKKNEKNGEADKFRQRHERGTAQRAMRSRVTRLSLRHRLPHYGSTSRRANGNECHSLGSLGAKRAHSSIDATFTATQTASRQSIQRARNAVGRLRRSSLRRESVDCSVFIYSDARAKHKCFSSIFSRALKRKAPCRMLTQSVSGAFVVVRRAERKEERRGALKTSLCGAGENLASPDQHPQPEAYK